jgi:hypothetical protein
MLEANVTRLLFMIMSFAVGGGIMIGAQEVYPDVVGKIEDKIEDLWDKNTKPDWEDSNHNNVIDGGDEIKLGRGNDVYTVIGKQNEGGTPDNVLVIKNNAIATSVFANRSTFFPGPTGAPYSSSTLQDKVNAYYDSKFKGHVDEQFVAKVDVFDPEFHELQGMEDAAWNGFDDFAYDDYNLGKNTQTYIVEYGKKMAFVPSVYDVLYTGEIGSSNYNFAQYYLRTAGATHKEVAVVDPQAAKEEDVDNNDVKSHPVNVSYDLRPALFINAKELQAAINAEKAENNK